MGFSTASHLVVGMGFSTGAQSTLVTVWQCSTSTGTSLILGLSSTVLGGDLPAGVLHGGRDGVGHGVGGISQELSISIGLGLRLSLSVGSVGSGGVTDHVHHVLAERLVLDLLSL